MATVLEMERYLDQRAPFATQMDFDNAGFLIGRGDASVKRVLVALDITEAVANEAAEWGAELIVSHHPVIFHPVRTIVDHDPTGRIISTLLRNEIAAICVHTNLDVANGGVNDALAERLGLVEREILQPMGTDCEGKPYGLGRKGRLPVPVDLETYVAQVKQSLGANGVRYADGGQPVYRVAVGGGACGDLWRDALAAGCDTFLTSDVKYNEFLDAAAQGLNLIDAGHYPTEQVVCPVLAGWLSQGFPMLEIRLSQKHREVFRYR
jgi:dinuclear metal center YbgI/SA1388 family protein